MADSVGSISYEASIDTRKLKSSAKEAEGIAKKTGDGIGESMDQGTRKADAAFKKFANTMKTGLIAGGLAAAAGIAVAVKSAGDFQSSLSKLEQASGATGQEMSALSKLARDLGQDNNLAGVTASDAAQAMVELSKAGLSVNDTMAATRGVMSLAKAGNIEFSDAAIIAASALNAFGMEGKDATKVADMLAAGANASQANLTDLAQGMQQSATVAKQFKLSLQENVTALALFANNGIRGSDAGTSLKTMLIALAKPSTASAKAMKEIGFNAYNAAGEFVGLEEMSKRLRDATSGLTEQQKQNTLATIFGTDAFRAAAVLADSAGKTYEEMSVSVGKVGAAQAAAAAQMGPFQKATEGLGNQMSDLGLTIGNKVIPYVTSATNSLSGFVQAINNGIPGAIATFKALMPVIMGVTVSLTTLTTVIVGSIAVTKALAIAQGALNVVMKANPFLLVASAAAGLVAAYITVTNTSDGTKNATDRLNDAKNRLKASTESLKQSESNLANARLAHEGSIIAVQRAEERLTQLKDSGRASALDLKEAEHQLAVAQESAKAAAERESAAISKNHDIKRQQANDRSLVATEQAHANAFQAVTNKVNNQVNSLFTLNGSLNNLNGKVFSYTTEHITRDIRITQDGVSSPAAKRAAQARVDGNRASGGPVRAGGSYFVGENPDGSLNKTSELFVPKTSGRIISSKDLQAALGNSKSDLDGGGNTYNITLPNVNNAQDFVSQFKLAVEGRF